MSGINFFLNTELRKGEHVYDYENIYYGIFKILYDKKCNSFLRELLESKIDFEHSKYEFQPNGGLFDFLIKTGEVSYFWEIKVWNKLSIDQFNNQKEFLKSENVWGVYVLLRDSFDNCKIYNFNNDHYAQMFYKNNNDKIIMLGEKRVLKGLEKIELNNDDSDFNEIVDSYKKNNKRILEIKLIMVLW